jgi:hypothetical protein
MTGLWLLYQTIAFAVILARMIRRGKAAETAPDARNSFLLSLVLFLLLVVLPGGPVYPHYGAVLIVPAAVLLAQGLALVESWHRNERVRGMELMVRPAALIGLFVSLWVSLSFLAHIHSTGGTLGDYGATLRVKQEKIAQMRREGTKRLSASAPLEYHYLLDRLQGVRTRLEDHPSPFVEREE